jgi:hypothetical protein
MKKLLIAIVLLTYNQSSLADTKRLVCHNKLTADYLKKMPEFYDEMCAAHGGDYCASAEIERQKAQECTASGVTWSHQHVILLDTNSLSNGQGMVEIKITPCWKDSEISMKSKATSTPTLISFPTVSGTWNVDRKTLRAGFDGYRDSQCVIENIDTSDNLI